MDRLYAPWRREYHVKKRTGCVFCDIAQSPQNDEDNQVFYRDDICFFVMNKFPYNPGHFMIIPLRHIANYEDLNEKETCHIAKMAQIGCKILKKFGADGINMGWNLGFDAGAGIPEHIHLQMVPRFKRDTNLMTTVFNTRVYSADFDKIYNEIRQISNEFFKK